MMVLANPAPAQAIETVPQGSKPVMPATPMTVASTHLTGSEKLVIKPEAVSPRQKTDSSSLPEATAASNSAPSMPLTLVQTAVVAPPTETPQSKVAAATAITTAVQETKQAIEPVITQEAEVRAQQEAVKPMRAEEQKALKSVIKTMQPDRPMEVRNTGESVKTAGIIPRDLATEVAVSDGTSAAVEQTQTPTNADQQHDLPSGQNSSHAFVQGSKPVVQQAVAIPQAAPVINHESVIEQVKERLSAPEVRVDGNQIRLQLRPADLGELQITLRMDDQKLRVEILAENKAVKTALLEHADTLKDVLAKQHITVDRFDVGTNSNNGSGQLFREGNRPEEQRSLPRYAANNGFKQPSALPVAATWQPRGNALVDVRF
jgi:flagellar hook-length control protein FliK